MTGSTPPAEEAFLRGQMLRRHGRLAGTLPVVALAMATGLFVVLWSQAPQRLLVVWFVMAAAAILTHEIVHLWVARRMASDPGRNRWLHLYRLGALVHGCAWGLCGLLLHALPEGLLHHAVLLTVLTVVVAAAVVGAFDPIAMVAFCLPAVLPSTLHYLGHDATLLDKSALALAACVAGVAASRNRSNFLRGVHSRWAEHLQAREEAQALERIRQAIALAGVSGWDYDPQQRVVHFDDNTRLAMRVGRGGAEPLAQLLDRLEPDSAQALERAIDESCRTGKRLSVEVVSKPWRDPSLPRVVLLSGGAVVEAGRVVRLSGTMQDMTVLRAREKEAADHARLLQQLVQNTNQGMWFLDNAGLTTDVNDAMCRLLGRSRQEVLGRSVFDCFANEDLAILMHQLELRKKGHKEGYEIGITRPDGTRVQCFNNATPLYDAAGQKVGSVGMWTDLTPLKAAMQRAEHSRKELFALLDAFPGFVTAVDDQGRYTFINRRMARSFALEPQQVIGMPMTDLPFSRHESQGRNWADKMDAGEVLVEVSRFEPPDGSDVAPLWLQTTRAAGMPTAEGRRQYYAFGTDITALKQAEERIATALAAAEAASRAKSEFLSQVSHELRTPLNAILGFAQLLQTDRQHPLAPTQQLKVQEMLSGASHLLDLINGLLDLGRIESGQFSVALQPMALQPLLRECLRLVAPVAQGRGIQMQLEDDSAPGLAVHADATRLTQIMVNLLGNAIKYNRPDGEVRVRARASQDRICIEVQDTGLGLSEQEQQRLFEPFQRLRAEGSGVEGTGIGLALSRRLAQAMSGSLSVRSTPGEGSTFTVDIARAPDRLPQDTPAPSAAGGPAAASGADSAPASSEAPVHATVLYIEDNPVNAMVMEAMVTRIAGLHMLHAEDGLPGLQMAIDRAPQLILTDIQMPGMDGFTLLQHLREHEATRHIPVVAITADATAASLERGREAGFSDYLTKPVQMEALHAVLRRLLSSTTSSQPVADGR